MAIPSLVSEIDHLPNDIVELLLVHFLELDEVNLSNSESNQQKCERVYNPHLCSVFNLKKGLDPEALIINLK